MDGTMKVKLAVLATTAFVAVLVFVFPVSGGLFANPEGIVLTRFIDPDAAAESVVGSVTRVTDTDLADVPKIRQMIDVALEQDFPLRESGFAVWDGALNRYWLYSDSTSGDLHVRIDLPPLEAEKYGEWIYDNLKPSLYLEYEGEFFHITSWIA